MDDQIQNIEIKVQQIIKEYTLGKKEIQRLQQANKLLSAELATKKEFANRLQQKIDSLQLTTSGMNDTSRKEMEKRIDIYLKDVDKCLALLQS